MVRQVRKFNGVVEFENERENYTGVVSLSENWVLLDNKEYIPTHKISSITCENPMSNENVI